MAITDEDRFLRMQRDVKEQPKYYAVIQIARGHDGSTGISAPLGDKQLCIEMLEAALEIVKANAKDRSSIITGPDNSALAARPEGYF